MRPVGYTRVSTVGQADDGVSLEAQKGRIEEWCTSRGFTLDPLDFHTDAGLSGMRSDNRPGLRSALESVCGCGPGGVLVVYSLSRLARSTKDALAIAERLERSGAQLVSVTESIDTTSAMGKLFFRLLAILAEFERDVISERTSAAMGHKRARGERISRNIPYGKSLNPDGRTLVNHPAEVATLAEIRQLSRQGLSHLAIARELTHRGVPTKKGGPVWARSSVRRILEGEKHRGQSDQGADSIGPVPAVVDSAAP